jgi:hypothetical protein
MLTYLIELQGYDTSGPGLTTVRFCSQPYLHPTAPGPYSARMTEPPTFRRDIFSRNTTGGEGAVSQGDLILANPDGELDYLRPWGFAGQICTVLIGEDVSPYSSFVTLIKGRVDQVMFDLKETRVRLKDRLQELTAAQMQPHTYAGNNILPDGLEGVDDLKDKPKPLCYGSVLNVSPPSVNTALLIYQVQDGALVDVPAVYDSGASLPRQTNYTSQADMMATAPAPGYYRVWPAGGYFRLGTSPVGTVTADVTGTSPATAAQIAKAILIGPGAIPPAEVSASDVAALDADNSAPVGIWLDNESTPAAVLDQILGSVGAWYGPDRLSIMRMQRVELPGAPVLTLRRFGIGTDAATGDLDMTDLRLLPTNDPDRGTPTWKVSVEYARNWTVQTGNGLVGEVTDDRRSYLANDHRTEVASDEAVKTPDPAAVTKTVTTLMANKADAQAEASRLLVLYKTRRDFGEVDTPLTIEAIQALDLGLSVAIAIPRFGYDAGRPLLITGMEYNSARNILTLAIWG